jgi:hypothetical protein
VQVEIETDEALRVAGRGASDAQHLAYGTVWTKRPETRRVDVLVASRRFELSVNRREIIRMDSGLPVVFGELFRRIFAQAEHAATAGAQQKLTVLEIEIPVAGDNLNRHIVLNNRNAAITRRSSDCAFPHSQAIRLERC